MNVMKKYDSLHDQATPKPLFTGARNTHIRRYFSSTAEIVPTEPLDLEKIIDPIKRTNITPGSSQLDAIKLKVEQLAALVSTQKNEDLAKFFSDFSAYLGYAFYKFVERIRSTYRSFSTQSLRNLRQNPALALS